MCWFLFHSLICKKHNWPYRSGQIAQEREPCLDRNVSSLWPSPLVPAELFQNMSVCCMNYVCQMFSRLQYFFEAVFLAKYVSLHNLPLYEQLCGENGITHHNIFFSRINPLKYANPVSIVSIGNNSGGNTFSLPISIVIKTHLSPNNSPVPCIWSKLDCLLWRPDKNLRELKALDRRVWTTRWK